MLNYTSRLDSDIVWPYGRIFDKEIGNQVSPSRFTDMWRKVNKNYKADEGTRQMFAAKTKMGSWVVSNCIDDPSQRMNLVKSLQKHISVDIYGKCGEKCDDCKGRLGKEYFFFMAFENSLALDYISEKTYTMMGNGLIPVVYGGADYARFLPPKSYINAQDFKSTKELADFLVALSKNTEEYLSYFWWQDYYRIETGQGYADLCGKVKEARDTNSAHKVQFYTDLVKWEQENTWRERTIQMD